MSVELPTETYWTGTNWDSRREEAQLELTSEDDMSMILLKLDTCSTTCIGEQSAQNEAWPYAGIVSCSGLVKTLVA
ncbi:uncharacterized protein MEPE_02158 [Melanopsichium pennsylvanicum]|uniref:Uncharacterized protein n=1 Tax=Melanopsichium pennsylvanicum TaxID=63383 RepID=A0AAJ4XK58_9BASI|nr:uncharacterized protein MEPE_02158 [Melanopsichium pennsylvanicum]